MYMFKQTNTGYCVHIREYTHTYMQYMHVCIWLNSSARAKLHVTHFQLGYFLLQFIFLFGTFRLNLFLFADAAEDF